MIRQLALLLLVLATACATQPGTNPNKNSLEPLMVVADEPVLLDEFLYAYNKNNNSEALFSKEDVDNYLDLYINFKLKVVESKVLGYDTTASFQKEFSSYKGQLDDSYLTSDSQTERLVIEAYERLQTQIKAAHILFNLNPDALPKDTIAVYEKAMAVRTEIENGLDFGNAAIQYSQDPSAKTNRGSLGYFSALQMVYPFETAAFTTLLGQISLPTRTRFGYHLIKVEDRRPSEGKVKVAHIMIRQPNESSEQKIVSIHEQLITGANWADVCSQNSEDQNSSQKGGELAPFGRGQIVPEFEDVAFSLEEEGEISDPFKTQFGWHIVKLIEKIPLGSFEDVQETLGRQIRRDSRSDVNQQILIASLMEENNFVEYPKEFDEVLRLPKNTFVKSKWRIDSVELHSTSSLFSINGEAYNTGEFYKYIVDQPKQDSTDVYLNKQYQEFKNNRIIQYEKDHLAEKYEDYRYLLNEYHDGILLFTIMEDVVWNEAVADSAGMHNYYDEHASQYSRSAGWLCTIYESPSQEVLNQVRAGFDGANSTKLLTESQKQGLESKFNASTPLSLQIEQGEYFSGEHKLLTEMQPTPGDTVISNNGRWYLIQVHKEIPEGVQLYKEIRGRVMSDYQTYLEKLWVEQLRDKYPVVVNEEILNHVYGHSQNK